MSSYNTPLLKVRLGMAFGLLAVVLFALTLPMTRLAVSGAGGLPLPALFVTAGRAAVAGLLSLVWLWALRAARPPRAVWPALAVSALGTVVGFPLFLALGLKVVPSTHAAVVTGVLPLATAVLGALVYRQRPSLGFWLSAAAGCGLVLGFAAWAGGGKWHAADGWLLLAVATGAMGYVAGARAGSAMPASQVICWVVACSLPFTLPVTLASAPWGQWAQVAWPAWMGFAYVSVVSMWLGFFAWYHGLALGGVVRVSQVQLLQPFLALLFAVPVAGEVLDPVTLWFALAVVATVFVGRRMSVGQNQGVRQ
jgi:drug/metabolite transporter (DMT)-like permease